MRKAELTLAHGKLTQASSVIVLAETLKDCSPKHVILRSSRINHKQLSFCVLSAKSK